MLDKNTRKHSEESILILNQHPGVFVNRIFSQKTIENSVTFFFDMAPVHFRCHMFYFAISSKLVPFSFNVSLNR